MWFFSGHSFGHFLWKTHFVKRDAIFDKTRISGICYHILWTAIPHVWSIFFPVFWEHELYLWDWEFQQCFVKNWERIHDCNFTIDLTQTLSKMASSIIETLYQWCSTCFKHLRDFHSFFLNFVTFNWKFFPRELGKNYTIFTWEYDQILAIK